jgi:hypothetical protein
MAVALARPKGFAWSLVASVGRCLFGLGSSVGAPSPADPADPADPLALPAERTCAPPRFKHIPRGARVHTHAACSAGARS